MSPEIVNECIPLMTALSGISGINSLYIPLHAYMKTHMYYACVYTCIFVHSLHGQNKGFCSVLFCSPRFFVVAYDSAL